LIPVPTFEALAFQISSFLPDDTYFAIANRANKDECYFAKFFVKNNSYIFDVELKLLNQSQLDFYKDCLIFGNLNTNLKNLASPSALYVAYWAITFGVDKILKNVDFLEPNYIKDFIVKERKK